MSLPINSQEGDTIKILGRGSGGYKILQNTGQAIDFGIHDTTPGITGFIETMQIKSALEIICIYANLEYMITASIGNFIIE